MMALSAILAACMAAMCALFCRRSPLLAGKCILTYMWPSYHEVFAAGHYRLMAYREQYIPQSAGRSLPVLFLPGNGGCHKQASPTSPRPGSYPWRHQASNRMQVRSMASETARRQARQSDSAVQLAWYTADFHEELSAFDAHLLERQAHFAVQAVQHLLSEHEGESILIVGHSMGGIIARAVMQLLAAGNSRGLSAIRGIVTLAAPHGRPPAALSVGLQRLYDRHLWPAGMRRAAAVDYLPIPFLSISGGEQDKQVLPATARFGQWAARHGASAVVEADTQDIPGVWASAGHQEIVWCNQLVVRLAGLLIDIAQPDLGREGVTALMQQAVQSGVAAAAGWHADIVAASDGAQTPVQMLFEHARSQAPSRMPSRQMWSLQQLRQQGYSGVTLVVQAAVQPHNLTVTLESSQGTQDLLARTSALPAVSLNEQHVIHDNRQSESIMAGRDYFAQAVHILHVPLAPNAHQNLSITIDAEVGLVAAQAAGADARVLSPSLWALLRCHMVHEQHAALLALRLPHRQLLGSAALRLQAHVPCTVSENTCSMSPCFQAQLVAFNVGGKEAQLQRQEQIRTGSEGLALWDAAVHGSRIGVVSDPRCPLMIRLQPDLPAAVLHRLHINSAGLPALLATVLLLWRAHILWRSTAAKWPGSRCGVLSEAVVKCTTWGLLSCAAALAPVVPWLAMLFGQALHLLNLAQSSTACQAVASACSNQRASNEAAPVEDSGALTCASDAVQQAHDVQGAHDQPVGWPAPSCSPLTSTAQKGHHAPTAAAEGSTRWEAAWQLCLLHSCCLTYSLFAAASWLRAAGKLKVVWHWHDGTVALAMAALPAVQSLNVKTMSFNPISCEQTRRLILSGAHFGAALATGAAALLGQPYRVLEVAAALSCISSLLI